MNSLSERLWPACLSSLQLDRFLLGELDEAEAARVREHVAGCAACSAAVETLRPSSPLPPLRVVRLQARPRRARWGRLLAAGGAIAAAASLLLVLRPAPRERIKGPGFSLTMYVQHGSEVRRAAPGEPVLAGDAVRFAVTAPAATYVAVLSLDPSGRASIYFPLGARAELLPAGTDVALPLATRLDGTAGEERIAGLFCSSAVELEPIRAALERGKDFVPDGCQVTRWSFVKSSR